jgi:hypothetical protein
MDMDKLLSQLAGEAVAHAAGNALANHVNRRKPGEPPPSSVHNGPTLKVMGVAGCAITVSLAGLTGWSVVIGRPIESAWFVVPFFSADLMYHDVYGKSELAKDLYRKLPPGARQIAGVDFTPAGKACPHGVDIATWMRRAADVLA